MKTKLSALTLAVIFLACSPKTVQKLTEQPASIFDTPIATQLDLVNVGDDRVKVTIDPGVIQSDTMVFRLPRVVQGTYDISNFGSFIDDFKAFDYSGSEIAFTRLDINSWKIPEATRLDRIEYYVNDTFDIENTDKDTPFSPSGTNIAPDAFVLNLHGFVGYFENLEDLDYEISILSKTGLKKASSLPMVSSFISEDSTQITDTYYAGRYFEVTDNPMMYGDLEIEEFQVGDVKIVLSVYSPGGIHSAARIKETVFTMMKAQKTYLGELNSTPRYDVFVYMPSGAPNDASGFGALEHHTSTVVVLPEWLNAGQMDESMIDVVSHEFFHIVTPLTVHSEDVHYFDYYQPTFSKHLWMYEGITEYFASHFQVYEELQSRQEFYEKLEDKIEYSYTLNDSMSFTEMSEFVIDEPYASNYINVYMKGALIGMSMDILLRELSNGQRSMLSLMKELSEKYGIEKPFNDDTIIDEITNMTYPQIGEFLKTHVVGNTPINYNEYFGKVGLAFGEVEQPTSLFFEDQETPFIDADAASGVLFFRNIKLNSTLLELGVQPGDTLISINGQKYDLTNIGSSGIILQSFRWGPNTEVTLGLLRNNKKVVVSGLVGTPTVVKQRLFEMEGASPLQIQLRNWWLEKKQNPE
jgi:predicted metalloprotease with PDZ domain